MGEGSDAIRDFNFPRVKLEEVGYAGKVHLHVMTFLNISWFGYRLDSC